MNAELAMTQQPPRPPVPDAPAMPGFTVDSNFAPLPAKRPTSAIVGGVVLISFAALSGDDLPPRLLLVAAAVGRVFGSRLARVLALAAGGFHCCHTLSAPAGFLTAPIVSPRDTEHLLSPSKTTAVRVAAAIAPCCPSTTRASIWFHNRRFGSPGPNPDRYR